MVQRKTPKAEGENRAFHTEVAQTLRSRIAVLESQTRALENTVRAHENAALTADRRVHTAEADREMLYIAVRVLAKAVPNTTVGGRKAREAARKLLESKGMKPPSTLGSSRERKKRRKRLLTPRSDSVE